MSRSKMNRRAFVLGLAVASLGGPLWIGCATYQFGARTLYPADVSTVYVPMFESDSYRRGLAERLTEAVAKEIELKTPFKVVGNPDADSVLSGRLISDSKRVTIRTRGDENRGIDIKFAIEVQWVNRRGELLQAEEAIALPSELIGLARDSLLVPEAGQSLATAQQDAIDQLAEQIVAMMEAPW